MIGLCGLHWYARQSDDDRLVSVVHEIERQQVQTYIGADGSDIAWDFIRLAFGSVADLAILPLQDVMRLGDEPG